MKPYYLAFALLAGCSESPPLPGADAGLGADVGTDAGEVLTRTVVRFVPADAPVGPRVVLQGQLDGTRLVLEVVAGDIDALFGWRAWIETSEGAEFEDLTMEPALGPDIEARYATLNHERGISVGGSRRNPNLGDVELADTKLATLVFTVDPGALPQFKIAGLIAKSSNGSALTLQTAGGQLETFEEEIR